MPKSPPFPEAPPNQPYIGGIVGTNVLCMFLHLYFARPEAGEAQRGYLHGGLLLDFIGQQGPSSKLHLFLLDLAILFLQLTSLAVVIKRKDLDRLQKSPRTASASLSAPTEPPDTEQEPSQDQDAEERGERRQPSILVEALALEEGIGTLEEQSQRRGSASANFQYALSDLVASGQAMIAELYIADTVRQQHNAYQNYRTTAGATGAGEAVRINFGSRRYELNLPFRS